MREAVNRRTNAVLPSYESRISRDCTEFARDPRSFRVHESMSDRAQYILDDGTRATARDWFCPNVQPRILRSARFPKIRSFARKSELRNGKRGWLLINNGDIHSRDLLPPVCFNFHGVTSYRHNKYSPPIDQIFHLSLIHI